ncbi:c-type cytochrome [Kaarinaea lacus]
MRLGLVGLFCVPLMINACGDAKPPESTPTASAPTQPTTTPTEESAPATPLPEKITESKPDTEAASNPVVANTKALETRSEEAKTTKTTMDAETEGNAVKAGLDLARASGCLACHAIDKKVVGPAWKDVAIRYADDTNARTKLFEKVAKGGRGNWTEVVGNMAMPPYSPRVSNENIEKLVSFVLSLNSQ